jgi:hypothetical protein
VAVPHRAASAPRLLGAFLSIGVLVGLAGCESITEKCQKEYPGDSAAADACFRAVLQQENTQQNQQDREDYRGRGGG